MTLINTVLLSGLLSTGAWAGISPYQGTSVDRIFAQWTRATPGCAVAVSKAGHLEYASAYGSADLEHGIPNSLDNGVRGRLDLQAIHRHGGAHARTRRQIVAR